MLRFFFRAVVDARRDPFCGVSWPHAVVWVLWNWRWLREMYAVADSGDAAALNAFTFRR